MDTSTKTGDTGTAELSVPFASRDHALANLPRERDGVWITY